MALSGRINGTVGHFSQFFSFYLLWSATQDPVANTSTITATTYWSTTDRGQDFDTVGTRTAYITIAGDQTSISKRFDVSPWPTNAIYEIQTKTYTVSHDADGTKSVSISAYADGTASSYGPNECSLSGTITLDAIDRTTPSVSLSLASRTANSLSISATATASCDLWEYTLDGGTTWTSFSTTDATAATCTLTGLNPGQSYTVQIRAQKTYNHLVGTSSASTYTTLGAATLNSVGEFYADASTVSINLSTEVYNASYTYSLDIKNGSTNYLSITGITAKPVGTQNFTITLTSAQRTTLLNAMANVASFSATFVLTTLNNGTTIGTSSATANIKTTTSSAPTQPTFSFKDSNASTVAVTGDNTKLIQGQSTLQITSLSATAKNGASIASYTIVVGGVTVTANAGGTVNVGAVSQSGTLSCRITAKDTRGYTSTATQNITCYPYAVPNVSSSAIARDDIDTTHVSLNFSGTFSTVGSNTVTAKYKYKKTSAGSYSADTAITLTKSGGTFSFSNSHLVDFDQDDSYDFVLTISDSLNDEVYYYTVPSYSPLIAYRREGLGINKVPDSKVSLDVKGTIRQNDVPVDYEFIRGTWAAATNALTGVTKDSALYEGKKIILFYPYAANSSNATLNLTLADGTTTGAKNCYYNSTTRLTTHYGQYAQVEMIYHENFDIGGTNYTGWWCIADRTDLTAYNIRKSSGSYLAYNTVYRYMILFTKSENQLLAANTTSNNTGTSKVLTTESFDPFGDIYYYSSTTTVSSGSAIGTTALYRQYNVNLRYAFNSGTTLTSNKAVYIVCDPQADGKVKLSTSPAPITQTLPTTADGKVYIYLGQASSTANCEIALNHPVYYYSNGAVRLWNNDADYVIEEGELYASGSSTLSWKYRKWKSGVAECWCTRQWNYSGNWVSWGNMYCTGWGYGPIYWYPANFFADVPNFTFTTSSVYSMWVATTEEKSGSNSTKDHMPELIAYRPNNPNAYITITVNIHAIGMSPST